MVKRPEGSRAGMEPELESSTSQGTPLVPGRPGCGRCRRPARLGTKFTARGRGRPRWGRGRALVDLIWLPAALRWARDLGGAGLAYRRLPQLSLSKPARPRGLA